MSLNTTQWDAIVIGAGPAGSLSAYLLASEGFRTLLTDRAEFPRPKLCGGCLAPAGQQVLRRAGLVSASDLDDAPAINRLDLQSGNQRTRLRVPGYRVVDRRDFDANLVAAAQKAGTVFRGRTSASLEASGQVRIRDDTGNSGGEVVRSRVVVVADGLKGTSLDTDPRFSWSVKENNLVGLGAIARKLPTGCAPDAITMLHGVHGYLGVAPLSEGRADIAAAVSPAWLRQNRAGPPLVSLAGSLGLKLMAADCETTMPGSPHLTRRRSRVEADGTVFLCGDAAGYVEPFTGEGMTWALTAAERLSPRLREALGGNYAHGAWTRDLKAESRRRRILCRSVGSMLRKPRLTRAVIAACESLPPFGNAVSGMLAAFHAERNTTAAGAA